MGEKRKRIITVTFTGKELFGNTVFDTTDEKTAKSANIFEQGRKYSPLTIITGEHELLPLVEKELDEMREGEEKLLKLAAEDAFGERKTDLIRVIPLQNFFEQKINPFPGLVIRTGNAMGKVQSVGSGRVRVDFNHPLAGRDVEYRIKLEKEFLDKKEVSEALYEKYYSRIPGSKKEFLQDTLTITLEGNAYANLEKVNDAIKKLAEELGVKIDFKQGDKIEGVKEEGEHAHQHDHEGHEHVHAHEHEMHEPPHDGHQHAQENLEHSHGEQGHEHEIHEHSHEGCPYEIPGEVHVHGPNCDHEHENLDKFEDESDEKEKFVAKKAEEPARSERPKSINTLAERIAKEKKSDKQFDVTRDSASTIQRPKKK